MEGDTGVLRNRSAIARSVCAALGGVITIGVATHDAFAQLNIVQDVSVIPPRALEAMDLDPFGDFPVGPGEVPMNVGVPVELTAEGPGGSSVTKVQWTIPGAIIKDYSIASARNTGEGFVSECSTTALSASDLQQNPITYHYTESGVSTVSVNAEVDGVPMAASMTFVVERHPKAEIFYVTGPGEVSSSWTNEQFNSDFEDRNNTIGEHPRWHNIDPGGEEFVRFHRGYIGKSDCWRGIFGYPCVQVYAGAPGYVPAGDDTNHVSLCCTGGLPCTSPGSVCEGGPGVQADCPGGQTCEARVGTGVIDRGRHTGRQGRIEELPSQFTIAGGLANFPVGGTLVTGMQSPYHNAHHSRICNFGDFAPTRTTPNDPVFWRFHHGFNEVFELWQYLKLDLEDLTIPAVECTSPAGGQVLYPDPDITIQPSCLNPQPDPCSPPSGSVFPLGISTVNCTVSDIMMQDPTFPAGQCTAGGGACFTNDDCPATEMCSVNDVCIGFPCNSDSDCPLSCDTAAFNQGTMQDVDFDVEVVDATAPAIVCPSDTTIECDESTDPSNTGEAMATDICDTDPDTSFSDNVVPGACPDESVITRTWTATDASLNSDDCEQTITVVDTTPPNIECNVPGTITPPDAPISFTATATDNCDAEPSVELTEFRCFKFTKKGKLIDKGESCVVELDGATVTIVDSGGVGDNIRWTVQATDGCGNVAESECGVEVINPGKGPKP